MVEEEREEVPSTTAEVGMQPEEMEEKPTLIDVTDKQMSIEEAPATVSVLQEDELQEKRGIEEAQEELRISKMKQKRRRITSYLSDISKQVEKNGNQINKINMMIQSLQKRRQTKLKTGTGGKDKSQLQSIKQIQSQVSQLQKQVTRIQKDIQRIDTAPIVRTRTKTKFRKRGSIATAKSRSKKSKLSKSIKVKKDRKGR